MGGNLVLMCIIKFSNRRIYSQTPGSVERAEDLTRSDFLRFTGCVYISSYSPSADVCLGKLPPAGGFLKMQPRSSCNLVALAIEIYSGYRWANLDAFALLKGTLSMIPLGRFISCK